MPSNAHDRSASVARLYSNTQLSADDVTTRGSVRGTVVEATVVEVTVVDGTDGAVVMAAELSGALMSCDGSLVHAENARAHANVPDHQSGLMRAWTLGESLLVPERSRGAAAGADDEPQDDGAERG